MSICLVCGSSMLQEVAELKQIPPSAQGFLKTQSDESSAPINLSVFQCSSCTHVQASAPLVSYYKDVITTSSLSPSICAARDKVIKQLCNLLDTDNPKILEIGAFKGHYLQHLRSQGYQKVHGLEHSYDAIASSVLSDPLITQGYLLDKDTLLDLPVSDILLCFNFLEHIPSPFDFLCTAKRFVADNGYLYLTMPSYDYILQQGLLQEFVADHVSYFTSSSLKTLFNRANLEIISLRSINNNNDLEVIARKPTMPAFTLDTSKSASLIAKLNIILDANSTSQKTTSFWGAGHRNLTLISMLNYDHISSIVDSSPSKQNLFAPVSKLPIISPDVFLSSPSDTLIVSLPGIYNQEVLAQISTWPTKPSQILSISGNDLRSH